MTTAMEALKDIEQQMNAAREIVTDMVIDNDDEEIKLLNAQVKSIRRYILKTAAAALKAKNAMAEYDAQKAQSAR